jgi:hypothetical protein
MAGEFDVACGWGCGAPGAAVDWACAPSATAGYTGAGDAGASEAVAPVGCAGSAVAGTAPPFNPGATAGALTAAVACASASAALSVRWDPGSQSQATKRRMRRSSQMRTRMTPAARTRRRCLNPSLPLSCAAQAQRLLAGHDVGGLIADSGERGCRRHFAGSARATLA